MSNIIKNTDNSGGTIIQNYNETKNRIEFFESIRSGFGFLKTAIKHKLGEEIELSKLSEKILLNRDLLDTQISTRGFISKYSLNFKPTSFIPMISQLSFEKHKIDRRLLKVKQQKQYTQTEKSVHHQIPVQVLPQQRQQETNMLYNIMFLYPMEFDSFLIERSDEKMMSGNEVDFLSIQNKHKAIPVLLPKKIAEKISEKYVKITGTIGVIDEGINFKHFSNPDQTLIELSSNFQNIYAEDPISFCLDCRDLSNFVLDEIGTCEDLKATMYIESQIDNLIDQDLTNHIQKINALAFDLNGGINFKLDNEKNIVSLPSNDDVFITSCLSNIIGFSTTVDLMNEENYKLKLIRLQRKHNKFRKEALVFLKKQYGSKHLLKPNFIFDFRRAKMFYHKGVLQSTIKDEILEKNPNLENTVKWFNS